MNAITSLRQNETMSSIDLLDLINRERLGFGEKEVRRNDFHARIQDELDGDHYESFVVENANGTESLGFLLTLRQCMYVAMRESKGVRRKVQSALESKLAPKIPQTLAQALRLAADQAEQLEIQAPKVAFFDRVAARETLMTATQVAQKVGKSAIALNKMLDDLDVYSRNVKRARVFKQWFVEAGYGELKQTELGYSQPLFTPAGEIWVIQKLVSEGIA